MTAFDEIQTAIRERLIGRFDIETIKDLEDTVLMVLGEYDIKPKETHLVVFDDGDADIIRRFFLAKAIQGCTEDTAKTYKNFLEIFTKAVRKHIVDITTDDIRLFFAVKKMNKASDGYLVTLYHVLGSFFGWLYQEELIQVNPMLRVEKIKLRKKPEEPLTEEQMEELRHHARTKRETALIEFLYSTGCRISEAVRLNRDDVDLDNREVNVLGKGRKWRKVYLTHRAKYALADYLNSRTDKSEALFGYDFSMVPEYLKQNNIVMSQTGEDGRLTKDAAADLIRKIGRRAGIRVHPHLFRKTVATISLRKGMPIDQVRMMLGHESIQTTTIYAQINSSEVKAAHDRYV